MLSPAEFARLSDLTLNHIYTLIWSGRLPAEKREGVWQIAIVELERRKAVSA